MKGLHNENDHTSLRVLCEILDGAGTCFFVSDLHTDEILFINDNMIDQFNLGGGAVGSTCWKLLQSGLDERCSFCPKRTLPENGGKPIVWEEQSPVSGRYYRSIDRIIGWHDGRQVHLQHSTDITDLKEAEQSLNRRLKQQELMSAISQSFMSARDSSPLIESALQMAGEFMGVNQAFMSKYQKDEGHLECLYEWYDERGRSYIKNANKWPLTPDMDIYYDFMEKGYGAVSDYRQLTHPNFEAVKGYDLRAFLNIAIEVGGEFWGVIGFINYENAYEWTDSDIHLGKLLAGVFSGVVSRNIAEEKLLEAKEVAEQASRAKGDFLSHMSHEMRTPMNAIIGMTGIAKSSGEPRRMLHCLGRIDSASKQLLGLINDILDVSKIEANKLTPSPSEFNFEQMLMNSTGVVVFRVDEKRQNLIVNIDKNIPANIIQDEMRLSQIIVNLLSNACKFTPEGGEILLNARLDGAQGDELSLLIEVIDNGIGISKDGIDRLFEPFEQADGSIVRKFGGTGLGLTICKGIVEMMGGRIWAESELGHGSKFSFTVRVKKGSEGSFPQLCRANLRVLAVDSAPSVRDYLARIFAELGTVCDLTGSGIKALELAKEKPYDVILVDCAPIDIDGIRLAKELKEINQRCKLIMAAPQHDLSFIEKDGLAAGVDLFISKPLFLSTIVDVINDAMGAPRAQKQSETAQHVYDFAGHSILVAEDIEINREILAAILEETNIGIDFAHNGAQAVDIFKENSGKYSLILMDIQMPEMDGFRAARKIRSSGEQSAKSIPIIAMTAHVFREDVEECLNAGMDDHIGKPIDTAALLSKLELYLQK